LCVGVGFDQDYVFYGRRFGWIEMKSISLVEQETQNRATTKDCMAIFVSRAKNEKCSPAVPKDTGSSLHHQGSQQQQRPKTMVVLYDSQGATESCA